MSSMDSQDEGGTVLELLLGKRSTLDFIPSTRILLLRFHEFLSRVMWS